MITVRYLNFNGGGYSQELQVEAGTQLASFLAAQNVGDAGNFTIRVNREIAAANQVLQDGDRITLSPTKVAGA